MMNGILIFLITIYSTIVLLINHFYYHFIGNNYFPFTALVAFSGLLLTYIGLTLLDEHWLKIRFKIVEILYFFIVITTIVLLTNAVQLTPFKPIDPFIITAEMACHIDLVSLIAVSAQHPSFNKVLTIIYASLTYQLVIIPLMVIVFGKLNVIREFYFLILLSALIGFGFYYFLPTLAPASYLNSPYFLAEQYVTGIKFHNIHQGQMPSTLDGGLIAFPSFHTIWAWLCVYILRPWPILFWITLPINLLLVLSCVMLGWHYVSDILGAIILIIFCHLCYKTCHTPQK